MIDFHNHLLPGVDDGAADIAESLTALAAMRDQGVRTVLVTPHLTAGLTHRPLDLRKALSRLDGALEQVRQLVESKMPELRLSRGVELMLDTPRADLSDTRVRLNGTSFVLVEFPGMRIPPHAIHALAQLRSQGWRPVVAHPERYNNLTDLGPVDEWRAIGCYVQVNTGSILGHFGERSSRLAWALLSHGRVDYLSSDFHARGRLGIAECRERLLSAGGQDQVRLLCEENARRLLADEQPLPVPCFARRRSLWSRIFSRPA